MKALSHLLTKENGSTEKLVPVGQEKVWPPWVGRREGGLTKRLWRESCTEGKGSFPHRGKVYWQIEGEGKTSLLRKRTVLAEKGQSPFFTKKRRDPPETKSPN